MRKTKVSPNLRAVFAEVLGNIERKSQFDVFVSEWEEVESQGIHPMDDLKFIREGVLNEASHLMEEYKELINDKHFIETLAKCAKIETQVLQARAILTSVISIGEMKLKRGNSDRSYAFARAAFFMPDNIKNEIRVYMGSVDELGKSLNELRRDPKFLDRCEEAIVKEMHNHLETRKAKG